MICACPACGASLTLSPAYPDGSRVRCGDCRASLLTTEWGLKKPPFLAGPLESGTLPSAQLHQTMQARLLCRHYSNPKESR